MDEFVPMNTAKLSQTKAYLAYTSPTADSNPSKMLLKMMAHTMSAMEQKYFIPVLSVSENFLKNNPELHASMTCALEILKTYNQHEIDFHKEFPAKNNSGAMSIFSFAQMISEKQPAIGWIYHSKILRSQTVVSNNPVLNAVA